VQIDGVGATFSLQIIVQLMPLTFYTADGGKSTKLYIIRSRIAKLFTLGYIFLQTGPFFRRKGQFTIE
jgi:hypothetical protein